MLGIDMSGLHTERRGNDEKKQSAGTCAYTYMQAHTHTYTFKHTHTHTYAQDHNPHRNRALFLQNMRSLFSPARMFLFVYAKKLV